MSPNIYVLLSWYISDIATRRKKYIGISAVYILIPHFEMSFCKISLSYNSEISSVSFL